LVIHRCKTVRCLTCDGRAPRSRVDLHDMLAADGLNRCPAEGCAERTEQCAAGTCSHATIRNYLVARRNLLNVPTPARNPPRCGACQQQGHNRNNKNCPERKRAVAEAAVAAAASVARDEAEHSADPAALRFVRAQAEPTTIPGSRFYDIARRPQASESRLEGLDLATTTRTDRTASPEAMQEDQIEEDERAEREAAEAELDMEEAYDDPEGFEELQADAWDIVRRALRMDTGVEEESEQQ
jgi:hypothetical protein